MTTRISYRHTVIASYIGYVSQAIINNFAPLLFLTFKSSFGIPLEKITSLIAINFCVQIFVDLVSAKLIRIIGYKSCAVFAGIFCGTGLMCLSSLPYLFHDAYVGILCAVIIYAIGGGLLEVIISPIVEACPTDKKSSEMSLLHSFYCWGHVFVVLASTLYFSVFGIENWRYLAMLWSLVPFADAVYFSVVPVYTLKSDEDGAKGSSGIFKSGIFWLFLLLMLCSGAAEQAMSQWSSAFAESGLKVSKTLGDIFGPCLFATLMGIARVIYSRFGEKISLHRFMTASCVVCVAAYLVASLSPIAPLALVGCAVCGLSVGILWPGVFSMGSQRIPEGGTAIYAMFALAGDMGCMTGPSFIGAITTALDGNMKKAMFFAIVFPIILIIGIRFTRKKAAH